MVSDRAGMKPPLGKRQAGQGRAGGSKDERPSIDRGLFTSGASTSLESVNTPRHLLDLSERIAC